MNLHNKMKNLENKYIDLANFYKKELVLKNQEEEQPRMRSTQSSLY